METQIPVDQDHSDIAKFGSRYNDEYLSLVYSLERHIHTALGKRAANGIPCCEGPLSLADNTRVGLHDCETLPCLEEHGNEISFIQRYEEGLVFKCNHNSGVCLLGAVCRTNLCVLAEYLISSADRNCWLACRGDPIIHAAARSGNVRIIPLIAKQTAVDALDYHGQSALQVAARAGNAAMVYALVGAGADINIRDTRSGTALLTAVEHNCLEMIKTLLRAGASVDERDPTGRTALHLAASRSHVEMIRSLLQAGASVHDSDDEGWTALHYAAGEKSVEAIRLLLQAGSPLEATNTSGNTPLLVSVCSGEDVVRLLLTAGANIAARSGLGNTVLHHAVMVRKNAIARLLLANGAPIEAFNLDGKTALQFATSEGSTTLANTLVEYGARGSSTARLGIFMAGRRWRLRRERGSDWDEDSE